VLRGDIARLHRCVAITTGKDGNLPRCKPFKYTYEKEIVMYAYFKKLDYFSTECVYSPYAYRGFAREYLKDLEASRNSSIIDIIRSAEHFSVKFDESGPVKQVLGKCTRCGYISSNKLCKACIMLDGLNKGRPRVTLQQPVVSDASDERQCQDSRCSSSCASSGCRVDQAQNSFIPVTSACDCASSSCSSVCENTKK